MRLIALLLMMFWGSSAIAGPWPREKGHGFLSFSAEYDKEHDSIFTSVFAEYGISSRVTAGLDLGFSDDELHKAVAFARLPLTRSDAVWKVAAELGTGVSEDNTLLRPGLHIGRNLKIGKRDGWLTFETLAYYNVADDDVEVSTDVTLGLNVSPKHKLLLQLQNGNLPMDPDYLNLATSVIFEKAPGFHLELGMKTGLKDDGNIAMKLGLWRSF